MIEGMARELTRNAFLEFLASVFGIVFFILTNNVGWSGVGG